jgi:hypothetical protein
VTQGSALLRRARELDFRGLGTPDSKRGWFANLFLGLNPYLFWVYLAAAVVNLALVGVRVSDGGDWAGATFNIPWLMLLAYVSRSLPKHWHRKSA